MTPTEARTLTAGDRVSVRRDEHATDRALTGRGSVRQVWPLHSDAPATNVVVDLDSGNAVAVTPERIRRAR